ncbi:S-acyl fatty acid synthase thioesterase, medium chain [Takifugu flavidus]|uniref:oleoyl-[acyl-carrier-protein] hydrolase n=1 Tax=Takifugu flavidus TaxID=433684 RepID=A0A5C6NFK3_9TELE|nr:S-acyl fatty acid synthase thioesterase, medium chain [Takifugu flavidus]
MSSAAPPKVTPERCSTAVHVHLTVLAVTLPGRESRAKEPFFHSMQQIVDEVIGTLLPVLKEKPFALFGHSFGAFTSLAVAEALKRLHNLEPVHLFLSGASAPYVSGPDQTRPDDRQTDHFSNIFAKSEMRLSAPKRSHLSDEDFLKWLTVAGGTPPELLANPQVLQLFLPALKADLHLVENYSCPPPECPLLSCPVTCFDGSDDVPHDLQG